MSDDEVRAEVWMVPEREMIRPEATAIGSWTCQCGSVQYRDWRNRGSVSLEIWPRCNACGDSARLVPLPPEAES